MVAEALFLTIEQTSVGLVHVLCSIGNEDSSKRTLTPPFSMEVCSVLFSTSMNRKLQQPPPLPVPFCGELGSTPSWGIRLHGYAVVLALQEQ